MKLLSFFLAFSAAQEEAAKDEAADKGIYGYNDYYGYGGHDHGYDHHSYGHGHHSHDYGYGKFVNEDIDHGTNGRKGNSLFCYKCHGRLDLSLTESVTNNAWLDCVTTGAVVECHGDERVCLSVERRRNDRVVEFEAMCKNPEACLYLWRRNERFKPPFHLFADQTEADTPAFFDDECRISASKFVNMRSQWESTCRHCCIAESSVTAGLATNPGNGGACNGPTRNTGNDGPLGVACAGAADCASWASSNVFTLYSITNIPAYMGTPMAFNRAHPGEGRNSLPEDKFVNRQNVGGHTLDEQSDRLSPEDTDFHNDRVLANGVNGAFGR